MSSFAKIGINNKVMQVLSVHDNELLDSDGVEHESLGVSFLTNLYGWSLWKQTSTSTRKNAAGIGYEYNETRDAFIAPKPYPSWILNETTCQWEAPTPYPNDGLEYTWNEQTLNWENE